MRPRMKANHFFLNLLQLEKCHSPWTEDKTPYWRTLNAKGELNAKYPGGVEAQKEMLEKEGHIVIQKGRTNIKYYVNDYEKALFTL